MSLCVSRSSTRAVRRARSRTRTARSHGDGTAATPTGFHCRLEAPLTDAREERARDVSAKEQRRPTPASTVSECLGTRAVRCALAYIPRQRPTPARSSSGGRNPSANRRQELRPPAGPSGPGRGRAALRVVGLPGLCGVRRRLPLMYDASDARRRCAPSCSAGARLSACCEVGVDELYGPRSFANGGGAALG